jgi:glycerol-3-phosphate dehydrogenase (NAD(P)+)
MISEFKNVIAIMAGLIEGLGFRFNTLSACVTRGVFEISLFCKHFGGKMETLNGLSGIGDIMLSALGDLSRNKKVGLALAKGETIEDIIGKALEVAEGVPTLKVLHEIIVEYKFNMPLCECIYQVAYEKMPFEKAKIILMTRTLEHENELQLC